jgi:hypothetical protein
MYFSSYNVWRVFFYYLGYDKNRARQCIEQKATDPFYVVACDCVKYGFIVADDARKLNNSLSTFTKIGGAQGLSFLPQSKTEEKNFLIVQEAVDKHQAPPSFYSLFESVHGKPFSPKVFSLHEDVVDGLLVPVKKRKVVTK